ncbi:hypothetical protein DOFOFD_10290 [Acetobacteraceae bacterium EV16P]|uniref:Uncharacterized protein n=1 Tax=Sorlinia euscelidii TaxID=3081148 RepID=A0ABU7U4G4_9PROT
MLRLSAHGFQEGDRVQLRLTARASHCIDGDPQEISIIDTRQLNRRLKSEENTRSGAFLRRQGKQILPFEQDGTARHGIILAPGQNIRERRFPRAIRPHDRVYLTLWHGEGQAIQDFFWGFRHRDLGMQVGNFEKIIHALHPIRHCLRD